ncbi:MAG: hydantoinase/oxoprolinase family protein [Lachnospiraceae bacterium]|nr:hydantoinase/oxoprolinase family protein [Lachnospiraceae bacterium]
MLAIGIDTGGTCTDAVIFDFENKKIVASAKSQTTHSNLEIGIENSLKKLPEDLLKNCSYLALSTTLATNACVENKGGRVLMIFIAAYEKAIKDNYRSYGFDSLDNMYMLNCGDDRLEEPDWDLFKKEIKEKLTGYDSIAIADMNSSRNNGVNEKKAADIIRQTDDLPIVCSYELFQDRNVLQRGASALLNAKLLPVIARFLRAVKGVLKKESLDLPVVIMRSDGSLMSEEYAKEHPVETLLCGPAASVKGGSYLQSAKKAYIVDMGGTTSDIAIVKNSKPVYARKGIRVGGWRTFVKGLYVDTFGLGGDSEVLFHDNDISLGERRVVPLCILANNYDYVVEDLKKLIANHPIGHTRPIYGYLILLKDIDNPANYTESELALCKALKDRPLILEDAAAAVESDVYNLKTARLENEGIIIRAGLTPTDMMSVKGDFNLYDSSASVLATRFLALSTEKDEAIIPELVYEKVVRKLYDNIVRIGLEDKFQKVKRYDYTKEIEILADAFYKMRTSKESVNDVINPRFATDATLVGIGAPIHVFLPRVAEILGTDYTIPKEAGVTNALGALIGDVRATAEVEVKAQYELNTDNGGESAGFIVYAKDKPMFFEKLGEALEFAEEEALNKAVTAAKKRGASVIINKEVEREDKSARVYGSPMYIGTSVMAEVVGKLGDF